MFSTSISPVDLKTALSQAVATGQAGTLVSARLHWQVPAETSLNDAALVVAELLNEFLQLEATQWSIRRASQGGLLHVMGTDIRGRTLVLTLNHGPTPDLQLTLFGNHGVVRLDRAEMPFARTASEAQSAVVMSLCSALSAQ